MARLLRIVVLVLCVGAFSSPPGASWGINTMRVPLNPDCWLGTDGVKAGLSGEAYRTAIDGFGVGFRDHLLKLRRHARH